MCSLRIVKWFKVLGALVWLDKTNETSGSDEHSRKDDTKMYPFKKPPRLYTYLTTLQDLLQVDPPRSAEYSSWLIIIIAEANVRASLSRYNHCSLDHSDRTYA
jgi:hypothetical protein